MRILVANTPLMYRETLAMAVHRHDPDYEVMMADPASMDGEAERFRPHTLVRDDDGIGWARPTGYGWSASHRQPPHARSVLTEGSLRSRCKP